MRIRTQRVVSAVALALTASCASAPAPRSAAVDADPGLAALKAGQFEQARRIAELEARIALLESDARVSRAPALPAADAPAPAPASHRSGARELVSAADEAAEPDDNVKAVAPKRPKLRLYGRQSSGEIANPLPMIPVVSETLPVVPLPEQRAVGRARAPLAADSGNMDADIADYRAGLDALRQRHWDDAVASFSAFMADHPRHDLVPSAQYWRAETHYAKREYELARSELDALLAQFPRADKAADALLKLGFCLRQLGAEDQARAAFRRLQSDYPNSRAASIAAREGST
jgi:tol-pal system protein YbgF